MSSYQVLIPFSEFREYLVETDDGGPWGDEFFHNTFDKYVEDDLILIEYKYGDYKNGKSMIKWRIPDEENGKVYAVRYTGSSIFAMWWCDLTDALEEED